MLIETLLDMGGLEYDAVERKLMLQPVLPGSWAQTGISREFDCGKVCYRLERPLGGKVDRLRIEAELKSPLMLNILATCPGLTDLRPWHSSPECPEPAFDPGTGRLQWTVRLPFGSSEFTWTWG